MKDTKESKAFQELQAVFNALCDEQEQLPREGFSKVFEALDKLEEAFTPQRPYTENEDNINKALELTGHSTDEAFCKAFKRNNQIMIEGNKIQSKFMEIQAMQQYKKMQKESHNPDEWQFIPISILAPKEIMNNVINPMLEEDALGGKFLFANETDIPIEDEDIDEFLMINAFELDCSLVPFLDELKQYRVVGGFLSSYFLKSLFQVLKEEAVFISDNTDKPAKAKNHIADTVKVFDRVPTWGIFFQILILQGLCRWLEGIDINEGDKGYCEALSLYDWLAKALCDKLMRFCYIPYGDKDKELLKPLCNYLYSTKIGQMVQDTLFPKQPPQANDYNKNTLPTELQTDKAIKALQIAVNAGLLNSDYSPTEKTKTASQKALLAEIISEKAGIKSKWNPFEALWGVRHLAQHRYDSREKVGKVRGGEDIEKAYK